MDLIAACESDHTDAVLEYLDSHPDSLDKLYDKHFEQCTPLHFAAEYGHLSIVNLLLRKGANPNISSTKTRRLPLHVACVGGFINVVRSLCKATENINQPDEHGCTPFHLACRYGELSCMETLIEIGCDICAEDEEGRIALHYCMQHDDRIKCVRFLLSRFPGLVKHQDKHGCTAYHHACEYGALNCLRYLVQNHRRHASTIDKSSRLPVHVAAESGRAEILKELLVKGVNAINEVNESTSDTITHCAAKSKSLECLHLTLKFGPDLSIQNKNGNTVQHIACKNKMTPSMIACLKNHGADFDSLENNEHDTAVYSARKAGNFINFEKAMKGEVMCEFCDSEERRMNIEKSRNRPTVHKKICDQKSTIYNRNLPPQSKTSSRSNGPSESKNQSSTRNSGLVEAKRRELVSRLYGEHSIFMTTPREGTNK